MTGHGIQYSTVLLKNSPRESSHSHREKYVHVAQVAGHPLRYVRERDFHATSSDWPVGETGAASAVS